MRDGQARKEIAVLRADLRQLRSEINEAECNGMLHFATKGEVEYLQTRLDAIIKHFNISLEYPKVVVKEKEDE